MDKKEINEIVPRKVWFSLKEICLLKNLNYKTACNKKDLLQPNNGNADALIGGRKMWNRETVINWIIKSDEDMLSDQIREEL